MKKPSFFLLLILTLCSFFLLSQITLTQDSRARICLYIPFGTENATALNKESDSDSLLDFYTVPSEKELYDAVASGTAQCGYIFPEDLFARLDEGLGKGMITVVTSPDSMQQDLTNESVYAALFEKYALHLLDDYLTKQLPSAPFTSKELAARYENRLHDGSVFSFSYTGNTSFQKDSFRSSFQSLTLRRILYLFLFISCYVGGFSYYHDRDCGFYQVIRKRQIIWAQLALLLTPLFLCSLAFFFAMPIFFPAFPLSLLMKQLAYTNLVSFCISILCLRLLRNKKGYTALLPPLLLAGCILLLI